MTVSPDDYFAAPTLVGKHVRLEQLQTRHAEGVLGASDDDEVFTWQSFARPTTIEQAEALVGLYLTRPGTVPWVQVDEASGEVAGLTTYYDIRSEEHTSELQSRV